MGYGDNTDQAQWKSANITQEQRHRDAHFVDLVIRENVKLTVVNIRGQSPILKEMEEAGEIKIIGAYYDMDNGEVTFFE